MSQILTFAEARATLLEVLRSKNVLLVLGAGASVSSGAPIASGLVGELRHRFPQAGITDSATLFDACREVEDTPAYGRQDLVAFVRDRLSSLMPSAAYQQIPRVRWRAIFTTNYDDLVEKAYQSPARAQTLQPVAPQFRGVLTPRDNHVQLHYLMGSIRQSDHDEGAPVLTMGDFHQTLQSRAPIMQLFQNLLADGGKVIYVGYSFNDLVFESILDEAVRKIGPRKIPYGHAILTGWPDDRRRGYQRISTRQVIPVEGSFEEFADLVREIADLPDSLAPGLAQAPASPAAGKLITVGSNRIELQETESGVYSEAFELLDDSVKYAPPLPAEQRKALSRALFSGETHHWPAFALGLVFKRPQYKSVLQSVVDRCREGGRGISAILLHGPAALGKTVMGRQLAFDLYVQHHCPVAIAKPSWRQRPDVKLLDRLFEDLETRLPPGEPLPPLVLIIDEAELLEQTMPRRLLNYLRARHRQCVLVLIARTNEFFRVAGRQEVDGVLDIAEAHALSDQTDEHEVKALLAHLKHVGIWDKRRVDHEEFWQHQVRTAWNESFFETLYGLVYDTQRPLREHVWSEFEKLGQQAREAYLLIAAVHQFGIPLKMEILRRALDVDFAAFEESVIRSDARDVLFTEHQTGELNLYFRGRTRLISQLVFERALKTPGEQIPVFIRIVRAVNPGDMYGLDELDALRTLLIQVLGPSGYDNRFSPAELSILFEEASKVVEDDVIEHHFGLVEKEAGRLLSAREHLGKALELSATLPYDLATLRESPQHIENSLAIVIGLIGHEALKRGDVIGADKLYEEAREHFVRARSGGFPNAAAYDAHARMLIARARRAFNHGSGERAFALCEVLDVVSEGIDNVNEEYRTDLIRLQTEVMEELGLTAEAAKQLAERAENASPRERARYEVLLGRLTIRGDASTAKRKSLHAAFVYAVRATESDPSYFAAWKLRADVAAALHPGDHRELILCLETALKCPDATDNAAALYELAVAYFYTEQYDRSAAIFARLRRATAGHGRGGGVIERAGTRDGQEPFEFSGRVIRTEGRGSFFIQCEELAAFGDIHFNPRGERFYAARVGDTVSFVIGFNYRGCLAVDVRRI